MKKILKISITLIVMISLFACGKNESKVVEFVENTTDHGINETTASVDKARYNLAQGMEMPNIVVETNKGTTFDLSKADKPVFINFWTTWCPPCRAEMPSIQNLYEEYRNKMDFILIDLKESKQTVQDFLIENEFFTFPVGYDTTDIYGDKLNIISIPTTFIVGKDKIIKNYIIGMRTEEQYREYINDALDEK